MEDIASGDAEPALQVERSQHFAAFDDRSDVWRILLDERDGVVAEGFAQLIPGAFAERVGRVLQKDAHNVAAWRRERRIIHGRYGQLQERPLGRAAVLGVVPCVLYIFDRGADVHGSAVVGTGSGWKGREFGEASKRQVNLRTGPFAAKAAHRGNEVRFERAFLDQAQERRFGI